MKHLIRIAACAAALSLSSAALAQDDAEVQHPDSYTDGEDGSATHLVTGIVCPATIGDLGLLQVLSFDRSDDHLGLSCDYQSAVGSAGTLSIFRADVPELVGPGTPAERWNRQLYGVLASYNGALPADVEGLGGDEETNMRGALFSAVGERGVPLQIGLWRARSGDWVISGQIAFLPTTSGWTGAAQLRQAVIDGKAAADSH